MCGVCIGGGVAILWLGGRLCCWWFAGLLQLLVVDVWFLWFDLLLLLCRGLVVFAFGGCGWVLGLLVLGCVSVV